MSEPLFQHIYLKEDQSYNILKVDRPYFIVPWHLHPEIEIMSIVKGEGSRFIGDSIENFGPGDLVIVGSNIPHCWKSSLRHHESNPVYKAEARVILFRKECFGDEFFKTFEMKNVREMFTRARRGILFTGKTSAQVSEKISKAYTEKSVKRFISFIDILNDLAESSEYKLLSSIGYKPDLFESDVQRLNKVFDFLILNFNEPLSLNDIASRAYMSPTAFCRYFKSHTNKTVISFLNEIRVGYAKKLLIENERNIGDIHFLCGFYNASNFYEQFKKIARCSPLQYRKQHENKLNNFID